jgi:hypothetical protein
MPFKLKPLLWYLATIAIVLSKYFGGPKAYNNFVVYKNVFWHTLQQKNLFAYYPSEYFDHNLYGPTFAILISPFAILPDWAGMLLWGLGSMWVLWKGMGYFWGENPPWLPLILVLVEATTALSNLQFNVLMAGGLLCAFGLSRQNNDWAAAGIIALLILTKIYGVVGLVLVFFTPKPFKLIGYGIVWLLVLGFLPSVISSPSFVLQSYSDWYNTIVNKNDLNQISYTNVGMQDISAMGLFKRISGNYQIASLFFLVPAMLLSLLPLIRFKNLKNIHFQNDYLAQLMIGLVIFSSSSESSTYIIAVAGYFLWAGTFEFTSLRSVLRHLPWNKLKKKNHGSVPIDFKVAEALEARFSTFHFPLFTLLIFLTILSPTDLVPKFIRTEYIVKYALKALPCLLAWIWISSHLLFKNYNNEA